MSTLPLSILDQMDQLIIEQEKVMLAAVLGSAAAGLMKLSTPPPANFDLGRFSFWVGLALVASFVPVHLPGGVVAYLNTAPLLAALFDTGLANPFAA